jgi:hypothetical protein
MPVPDFSPGEVLTAAAMDSIGLWLVKTQTVGAGVSSVTVTDAFSADYDNYLIYMSSTGSTATTSGVRLGASTTGYWGFLTYGDATTNTVLGAGRNNQAYMFFLGGCQGASQPHHLRVEIQDPFSSIYTKFFNGTYQSTDGFGTMQGEHRVASSYTDFTVILGTGTITGGTIRVYGYRK